MNEVCLGRFEIDDCNSTTMAPFTFINEIQITVHNVPLKPGLQLHLKKSEITGGFELSATQIRRLTLKFKIPIIATKENVLFQLLGLTIQF